jgi:hypothetical protein
MRDLQGAATAYDTGKGRVIRIRASFRTNTLSGKVRGVLQRGARTVGQVTGPYGVAPPDLTVGQALKRRQSLTLYIDVPRTAPGGARYRVRITASSGKASTSLTVKPGLFPLPMASRASQRRSILGLAAARIPPAWRHKVRFRLRFGSQNPDYAAVFLAPALGYAHDVEGGVLIARRVGVRWRVVTLGSEFGCAELPSDVWPDLGVGCIPE